MTRVVMRPPGQSGKAKRGHLCFDASFETGKSDFFEDQTIWGPLILCVVLSRDQCYQQTPCSKVLPMLLLFANSTVTFMWYCTVTELTEPGVMFL